MMEVSRFHLFLLGFLLAVATRSHGESSTCLTVYKQGGAPAVFQSPKCPRWQHSDYTSHSRSTARCQSAMLQGRRKSMEDRTLCVLDLRIPFPGNTIALSHSLCTYMDLCIVHLNWIGVRVCYKCSNIYNVKFEQVK